MARCHVKGCSEGWPDETRVGQGPSAARADVDAAVVERFARLRTLRLIESLYGGPASGPCVAESSSSYVLSRPATAADVDTALALLKRHGRAVAEIESLIRGMAETVRAEKVLARSPDDVAGDITRALAAEAGRLEGLKRILPEERIFPAMRKLEELVPQLDMLLRTEAEAREILSFAFGDRVMNWVCGKGEESRVLISRIEKLAPTDLPVLICGETGTGKELAARFIHSRSRRARGPFVAINCAAIPSELLESQLFGQRAGAFTSAREQNGLLDAADGGTFFMDEVSELSLDHQAKLLRFIEEREYIPVGGRTARRANVRLLCATNRGLTERVRDGAFRLDLFHRINDFLVRLQPLRERRQDLPILIEFFLRKCANELGQGIEISPEAKARLLAYGYPGNIREMEKTIRRACILCDLGRIGTQDLYFEGGVPEGGEQQRPPDLNAVTQWLDSFRLARRAVVAPRMLDFLRAAGGRWFSSREYGRAVGLSDSQARAQLKQLAAENGPLEHNGEAKALSRYHLRERR
ncbi:MAG: sigma 54-interacting transcriptional regulator [Pseudomonadota bacterium]